MNPELVHHVLTHEDGRVERRTNNGNRVGYIERLGKALFDDDRPGRVLSFADASIASRGSFDNKLKVLYGYNRYGTWHQTASKHEFSICKTLDAPDLVDDFYLNLLDYSSYNVIAVAIGKQIYVYDIDDNKIVADAVRRLPPLPSNF